MRQAVRRTKSGVGGKSIRTMSRNLALEPLERRDLLAVITVTNTDDAGPATLRQAILDSNASVGVVDTIAFDISGAGPHSIQPLSALPTVEDPVVIDGFTQAGASPNTNPVGVGLNTVPMIELDGSLAGDVNGLHITAGATTVRGLVINRFAGSGILLVSNGANSIEGNFIGTDTSGTIARGNTGGGGVRIGTHEDQSSNNVIGGVTPEARNLISGNVDTGISVVGALSRGNVIRGNLIGTDVSGALDVGNGDGVVLGSSDNRVGGTTEGAANVVAFNESDGVRVVGATTSNRILANSIFSNGHLGINLASDSVTVNDQGDSDLGPNALQNFPVLHAASSDGETTDIMGTLNSAANMGFAVQFFSNRLSDPSGHGEGRTYLGSTTIATDAAGNAQFDVNLAVDVPVGHVVTATATTATGNTSEFSNAIVVVPERAAESFVDGGTEGVEGIPFELSISASGSSTTSTYVFTGLANGVFSPPVFGLTPRSNETPMVGLFAVNNSDDDGDPGAKQGVYQQSIEDGFQVLVDGVTLSTSEYYVRVTDSLDAGFGPQDVFEVIKSGTLEVDGAPQNQLTSMQLNLFDTSGTVFDDDSFPETLSVNDFDARGAGLDDDIEHSVDFFVNALYVLEQAGNVTYSIDWSDGSPPETIEGPPEGLDISHVYDTAGDYAVSVVVTDPLGKVSVPTTLDVQVLPNQPPTISEIENQTADEDGVVGPLAFTVGDLETPVSELVVTVSSSDTSLIPDENIEITGDGESRSITIAPAANQSGGPVTITVDVDDGVKSASQTFEVSVTAVNDLPTISDIADQSIDENTQTDSIEFIIGDVETSADALTVTASSDNQALLPDGSIVVNGSGASRSVVIEPAADQFGEAIITLAVDDGEGGITSREFHLTVNAVNDSPTITPIADQTTDEDVPIESLGFTVADVETAAASLTVSGTSTDTDLIPLEGIVFGGTDGNLTVSLTPAPNRFGSSNITITVDDGDGATATTSFDVTVSSVDDPPVVVGPIGTVTVPVNSPDSTFDLSEVFVDPDVATAGDSLTYWLQQNDANLVNISIANGILTLDYEDDQVGEQTIIVRATDTTGLFADDTILLKVTPINGDPTITDIPDQTTDEDVATGEIMFGISDAATDADSLTVTASSDNAALVPDASIALGGSGADRTIQITPATNQFGDATITVTVSDSDGSIATDTFSLAVSSVNDPPVLQDVPDQTTEEDTEKTVTLTISDVETNADALVLTGTSDNQTLVPDANIVFGGAGNERTVTVTPAEDQSGSATITIAVSDADGDTSSGTFVLTVAAVNDAPVNAVPGPQETDANSSLTFSAENGNAIAVSDVDAGDAAVGVVLSVSRGTVTLATTDGLATVDGDGTSGLTISGTVSAINSALDGLRFAPPSDFAGEVTLTIVTDDLGNTGSGGELGDAQTVDISVRQLNQPPQITSSSSMTVAENKTSVGMVSATDPDGDALTFSIIGGVDNALFAINSSSGELGFLVAQNFEAPRDSDGDNVYEVEVAVDDGHGGVAAQVQQVTVTDADEVLTAAIEDFTPDVRAGSVDEITIVFGAEVTGFDVSDFSLRRYTDESVELLPGSAALTSTDGVTWTLGELSSLTTGSGIYVLTLSAEGSGIQDQNGTALIAGDSIEWINGAGDADTDGKFDQFDLVDILQANLYLTGQPATWSQGDWNGDGIFNQFDIVFAQQTQPPHYLQGPFAASAAHTSGTARNDGVKTEGLQATDELDAIDSLYAAMCDADK